ncbi:MAG TPA: cupin domain-containing protein [Gaiellaceae bacterium]|nr:cupin domain-containing protein [Gaiellaceae bacterium]
MGIAHWDDVESHQNAKGEMDAVWQRLGDAAGCKTVGLSRLRIAPGKLSTPPHSHSQSEELVYVLAGSGWSWQDEQVHEVRAGDCIVHVADHEEHTLRAGDDGLDVLIWGTRHPIEFGWLPRSGAVRIGWPWVQGRTDDPWDIEAQAEPLGFSRVSPRPKNILNIDDCPDFPDDPFQSKELAGTAGSVVSGLNWLNLKGGDHSSVPHMHSTEEEHFVVLEGEGVLELWPSPLAEQRGAVREDVPLRAGHVVCRPGATRIAHRFTAGAGGMKLLVYGTRDFDEVVYYPRSKKIFFRGLGVITRVEHIDYMDGEED